MFFSFFFFFLTSINDDKKLYYFSLRNFSHSLVWHECDDDKGDTRRCGRWGNILILSIFGYQLSVCIILNLFTKKYEIAKVHKFCFLFYKFNRHERWTLCLSSLTTIIAANSFFPLINLLLSFPSNIVSFLLICCFVPTTLTWGERGKMMNRCIVFYHFCFVFVFNVKT